jgi:hypothetical protein
LLQRFVDCKSVPTIPFAPITILATERTIERFTGLPATAAY